MHESTDPITGQQREDDYVVGPGNPPKEHQWKKGQSGNPAGSPKARTNLYRHVARFADMTDAELAKIDRSTLRQSEKAALIIVERMASGELAGSERMARYIVDREEGKPIQKAEHTLDATPNNLTDIVALVGISTMREIAGEMSNTKAVKREYDEYGVLVGDSEGIPPETPKGGMGPNDEDGHGLLLSGNILKIITIMRPTQ